MKLPLTILLCASEMESFKKRMEEVDARGNALTERAVRLEGRVMNIAQVYNTTVRLITSEPSLERSPV